MKQSSDIKGTIFRILIDKALDFLARKYDEYKRRRDSKKRKNACCQVCRRRCTGKIPASSDRDE